MNFYGVNHRFLRELWGKSEVLSDFNAAEDVEWTIKTCSCYFEGAAVTCIMKSIFYCLIQN